MKTSGLVILSACVLAVLACAGTATAGVTALQQSRLLQETFYSIGSQDGWVVGVGDRDDVGGPLDGSSTSLRVGDENGWGAHQIRTILSFQTGKLPDHALITSATLVLKQESSIVGGGNPFVDFGGLLIDVKMGSFGAPGLAADDFQAVPNLGSLGPYTPQLADSYAFPLSAKAYGLINKWPIAGGLTQFRLRFALDSDHNDRPNYIHFSSGDESTESLRPQLVVEYHLPARAEVGQLP